MKAFEARWTLAGDETARVACGRPDLMSNGCIGHLGNATLLHNVQEANGNVNATAWVMQHPFGYRRLSDGRYEPLKPAAGEGNQRVRREGSFGRERPERLRVVSGTREVLGPTPGLPATIICPHCDRDNVVSPPP